MKTVQEILGHGDIRTTMNIYGHVFPSTHQDAMDEMDEWLGYDEDKDEENNSNEKD
jgi:integrase